MSINRAEIYAHKPYEHKNEGQASSPSLVLMATGTKSLLVVVPAFVKSV